MCIHFLQQRKPAILPCLQVCIVIFLLDFQYPDHQVVIKMVLFMCFDNGAEICFQLYSCDAIL